MARSDSDSDRGSDRDRARDRVRDRDRDRGKDRDRDRDRDRKRDRDRERDRGTKNREVDYNEGWIFMAPHKIADTVISSDEHKQGEHCRCRLRLQC